MKRNPNRHADSELRDAVDVTRFWSLVERADAETCWPWRGGVDQNGYGLFRWRGRMYPAHELALSFTTGEVRHPSLDTCHACDNAPCCNPSHLRFDTRKSNVADMDNRGRRNKSNSKLSVEDVVLIRERRSAGARQKDLAAQFGISDGQVSMIVRGLRWPELGGPIETERQRYIRG